jgi:hypothetical protein
MIGAMCRLRFDIATMEQVERADEGDEWRYVTKEIAKISGSRYNFFYCRQCASFLIDHLQNKMTSGALGFTKTLSSKNRMKRSRRLTTKQVSHTAIFCLPNY